MAGIFRAKVSWGRFLAVLTAAREQGDRQQVVQLRGALAEVRAECPMTNDQCPSVSKHQASMGMRYLGRWRFRAGGLASGLGDEMLAWLASTGRQSEVAFLGVGFLGRCPQAGMGRVLAHGQWGKWRNNQKLA